MLLEADVTLRLVRPAITLLGPLMNVLDSEEQAWFSVRKLDSSRWNKWIEWCVTNQHVHPAQPRVQKGLWPRAVCVYGGSMEVANLRHRPTDLASQRTGPH